MSLSMQVAASGVREIAEATQLVDSSAQNVQEAAAALV